jgi:hypothetical protein
MTEAIVTRAQKLYREAGVIVAEEVKLTVPSKHTGDHFHPHFHLGSGRRWK